MTLAITCIRAMTVTRPWERASILDYLLINRSGGQPKAPCSSVRMTAILVRAHLRRTDQLRGRVWQHSNGSRWLHPDQSALRSGNHSATAATKEIEGPAMGTSAIVSSRQRSEERRVGKECRSGRS